MKKRRTTSAMRRAAQSLPVAPLKPEPKEATDGRQ